MLYPGLPSTRSTSSPRRQMRGFGGMVSLRARRRQAAAERFLARLRVFALAESLGGVESLACYPLP